MSTMVKMTKAAELVAKHLEELILEGSLRPGEALLPERELAIRLSVSRPTLRDGLKILEERGLMTSKEGGGLKVAQLGNAAFLDPLVEMLSQRVEVADDHLEFRDIVESSAAAMAAQRSNAVDIRRIEQCLEQIEKSHLKCDPLDEAEADADLHLAIYEGSHNVVILQVMRALSGNLRTDVLHNRTRLFTLPDIRDLLRDQHRAIAQAIIGRDPDGARGAAHDHLTFLRNATREIRDSEAQLSLSIRRLDRGGLSDRKKTT